MALKITDQNGVFMIEASINTTTSESFRDHFKSIIDQNKKVIINI
jgi:anti-anti-sigma regulatory factor